MDRLTPELHLISTFDGDTTAGVVASTRELDFNLARRSGVIINRVQSQITIGADTTSGLEILGAFVNELDLDPDNVAALFGANFNDTEDVVVDSSRAFRHIIKSSFDTAAGLAHPAHTFMDKDWHHVPAVERPISITNLRHHIGVVATVSMFYHIELHVDYFIVELELREIGILNASRR